MSSIRIQGRDGVEELPLEEFERRVRLGELPPETLVSLEVVTGRRFLPLGQLELYQTLADPEAAAFRARLSDAAPLLTAALVGIQVRIYLWSKLEMGEGFITEHLTNFAPAALEQGEVYRLLTYGFMHLSFTHLALNMLFLAYAGANLERAMGWRNLACTWLVSVISGGLLSMLMSPGRGSLGASGGDFGLIAAVVVFGWKYEDHLPERARLAFGWAMLPYLIYPLFLGLQSSNADNWGHIGGLLGGALMATWLQPDAFSRHHAANRTARGVAAGACLALFVGLFFYGHRLIPTQPQDVAGLRVRAPTSWAEQWVFTDDWGRISATERAGFVATTRTYGQPTTPVAATRSFVAQLGTRAQDIEVLRAEDIEVDGWPATRLTLAFKLSGQPQIMEATLITRGPLVYRVHLHADDSGHWRYTRLAERIFGELRLDDPPQLARARAQVRAYSRSWGALLQLAQAASQAGEPAEARAAFERSYRYSKEQRARVAVELLDFLGDYPEQASVEEIESLVALHAEDPEVIVQAARAFDRQGVPERGDDLLRAALERWPEEQLVQRAWSRRGLSLPLVPSPPEGP